MSSQLNHFYEFEDFRLDAGGGTLWRGDDVVSLSPKAVEVLKLLVVNRGEIVSKQEIFDSVWADTFVEDGVLTQNIYTLRHALGRDREGRQFIETIPRRGYRFAGRVTVEPKGKGAMVANAEPASRERTEYDDDTLSAHYLDDDSPPIATNGDHRSTAEPVRLVSTDANSPAVRRRLWIPALVGLAVLAAAGIGLYTFYPIRGDAEQQASIAPIEQIRFQSLTDTGDIIHPTISPNGAMLAFVRVEGEQSSVWVQQIATRSSVQTLPPSRKGYESLAFSSDGTYLFFREDAEPASIYQAPLLGGTPKKVADNVWSDFSVSPDNRHFAFIRRDAANNAQQLILASVADGSERVVGTRQLPYGYRGAAPAWSPDGKTLAVAVSSTGHGRAVIAAVDLETGKETELQTPNFREITCVLWTPDAKQLLIAARLSTEPTSQLWMMSRADGQVRRLTNDLEAYFWLSISADGRTLITRQQRIIAQLWLLPDGDLKKARQLTSGGRTLDGYVGLTWTPDGKIVYTSRSGNFSDLFSMNIETGERIQLTSEARENTWPVVTRDGRYIVFVSTRTGSRAIWRMDVDGGNQKQLTSAEEGGYAPAPSADSNGVFFIRFGSVPSAIWRTSIDGEGSTQISQLGNATAENFLSASPDGSWLAYRHVADNQKSRGEEGTMQIGVVAADGSGEPRLFDVSQRRPVFHWTSENSFDYAAGTFNSSSLWRQPLEGEARKLIDFPDRVFNFAWSDDGKNLVVSRGRLHGDAVMISNLP